MPTRTVLGRAALVAVATTAMCFAAARPAAAQTLAPDQEIDRQLPAASHVVIPHVRSYALRTPAPERGIRIDAVSADIAIREQAARTTLEIELVNTSRRPEQAVLLLPVPDGAVVSGFAIAGSAALGDAEILPRDEARRLYDAIVSKLLDPALLEFAGYNLVRTSVFPVPPEGTHTVRLTYEHLLPADGGRIDYVLPRSESLARRRPWRVAVTLDSKHPISTVYSPSHAIAPTRRGPGAFDLRLDASAALQPGPFRLSYLLDRGGVSASLFAYPDEAGGGGHFLLMAGLPAIPDATLTAIRREVTLVIDRSGSMAGAKMDQALAAALQVVEGLDDGESFNIIDYSTAVSSFSAAPVEKTRGSTLAARRYLESIRPGGGTNIHDALATALAQPASGGVLPIVLFLTDGLPTIGRTGEVEIREMVARANAGARRIFTFGVGNDVNVPLLDRIADVTRGTAAYVLPEEDVEVKVAQVFRRLYGPIFAQPELRTREGDAVSTRLVYDLQPDGLPDLFDGDQLIVLGRYREALPFTIDLSGNYRGETRTFSFAFDPAAASTRNAFVPRLWASRRIASLIEHIRQAGAASSQTPYVVGASVMDDPRNQELVDEILRLSTTYGILTEYTSFLATDGTDLANWGGLRIGCSTSLDARAVRTRSGAAAVNQAFNYRARAGQTALDFTNSYVDASLQRVEFTGVQQVCDRAFFRRGNRWIDSRLIAASGLVEPDETLMIGTPEHAMLLRDLVRSGRQGVLSLAGEILLEVNGRVVLVTDGC